MQQARLRPLGFQFSFYRKLGFDKQVRNLKQ